MNSKLNFVVFSGAGMSAESGLRTFRGHGGLWEGHKVEEVATPEAWRANPELVNRFYNERRKQLFQAKPNEGHYLIARLEEHYKVQIVTQNIDDLHERAGSTSVVHLHGELRKVRSERTELTYTLETDTLRYPSYCPEGGLLRPHVVWFGEAVPEMERAAAIVSEADILLVIGTSLQVYPAAALVHYAPKRCKRYHIDPSPVEVRGFDTLHSGAAEGMKELFQLLGVN